MPKGPPIPVRFESAVAARLASFVASRPGLSLSGAANLLVDEGLRMTEHPGIVFRDGPSGRRAGCTNGPDVWEVMRAVKSARGANPTLGEDEVLDLVVDNGGLPLRLVRTAVSYWARYPDEIDAEIELAQEAEHAEEVAFERQRDLLAR